MLKNLDRVLYDKGISRKVFAEYLGISEKTVQNKIKGVTEFTYPEARKLSELLPEYNISYLMEEGRDSA